MFDLHAGKQIVSLEYYHFVDVFIEYEKYIRVEFSHVTEIPKKGIFTRKPLKSVACKDVEFLKNDPNLIWLSHCLQFSEKTEIGFNPSTGEKKSIQVEILPCQTDCLTYPTDADYEEKLRPFIGDFVILSRMLDSKSNFEKYDEPFSLVQTQAYYSTYSRKQFSKRSIIFQQILVETNDGVIIRGKRNDINLTQKETLEKSSSRIDQNSMFGTINLELDKSVLIVQRIYPTFVDMLADFGGMCKSIISSFFLVLTLHHLVHFEQGLLNEAIDKHDLLSEDAKTIAKLSNK